MRFENNRVFIVRSKNKTSLFIADRPGVYKGRPNIEWDRVLSDNECLSLLENPWCIFKKPNIKRLAPQKI